MSETSFQHQETLKDDLEEFFAEPSKGNLPQVLKADVEYDYLEFKGEWPENSQLARSLLAFSNSGGGAITIGVEEKDEGVNSVGVEDDFDPATIGDKVEGYVPDSAHELYKLETFRYEESVYDEEVAGKKFQVLFIEGAVEKAPLVSTKEGDSIDEGSIYIRRNTKSVEANHEEIQDLLENRAESAIEESTAELNEELQELKILYEEVSEEKKILELINSSPVPENIPASLSPRPRTNTRDPETEYEEYIYDLIEKKKVRIESRLGVRNIDF